MTKTIKVAIDISPLNDGNSKRGVGFYTRNLVDALQSEIKHNSHYKNFKIDLIQNTNQKLDDYDVVHYPYFDPFYLTLPSQKSIPQIITIHDLIPIEFKQHFPAGIRGFFKWNIQKLRAKQSRFIITVSSYSKYVISNLLGYPSDKIYVTLEGATSDFKPTSNTKKLLQIKNKYSLPDKYIFYTGDINWNKNIPSLARSCIELGYPLVIAGKQAIEIDNLILEKPSLSRPIDLLRHLFHLPSPQLKHIETLKELFKNPFIKRLGFVDSEDLPYLYNLATIYCQPSFAEGFGLCPLEAMQSGTPVVYSKETSIPEIMGEAGIGFDPYDPTALTKALSKLWNSPTLQKSQSALGIKQASAFSWQQTAIQTLEVYVLATKT